MTNQWIESFGIFDPLSQKPYPLNRPMEEFVPLPNVSCYEERTVSRLRYNALHKRVVN